jgi:photosystem II stability/assembly factor-like uncharacterized protein
MKYEPFPFSDLKKLHIVDPSAFLHTFRRTWVFLIAVICILMPVSNAIAQGWSVQTVTSSTIRSVYFVDATTGWAVGQNGIILKTIDGSATWTAQTSGTTQTLNSVYFVSATTGWAVGNDGTLLKTIDGGTNWSVQTSGTTRDL